MINPFLVEPIRRVGPNRVGRDFAVGDVHGYFSRLSEALSDIGFDESKDRLFSVGDLIDRGPESAWAIDWLDKPWFFAVMGNHEQLAWRRALGKPLPMVRHEDVGGEWMDELTPSQMQAWAKELASLPMAMEVQTDAGLVGLIHADCPYDDWARMNQVDWSAPFDMRGDAGDCLWSYARLDQGYEGKIKGLRALIHGHALLPKPRTLGNVFYIDTGGWRPNGFFTLLDLQSLEPAKALSARKTKK